jgi:hypothetical protein
MWLLDGACEAKLFKHQTLPYQSCLFELWYSCAFKPDSRLTISTNFALPEASNAAYEEQQTHLQSIVVAVDDGIWPMDFNGNKNR